MNQGFDKETFKKAVIYNVKNLFRKTVDEVTQEQMFQAVSYAVKDVIIDEWIETHKTYEKEDVKTVYYLSMEFLMGRALGNNIINICAQKEIKEVLDELGFDLNVIEDQEPDQSRKWRPGSSGCMLLRLFGNSGLSGIRLRYPLPLSVCLSRKSKMVIRRKFRTTG